MFGLGRCVRAKGADDSLRLDGIVYRGILRTTTDTEQWRFSRNVFQVLNDSLGKGIGVPDKL
jgi:hypothetical protein